MESGRDAESARDRATADIESAISELFRAVKRWQRELARRFDPPLSPMAFGLLRYLRVHGPVRAGDVAAAFEVDKAAVSRGVAQLREAGLLDESPDPEDGRAVLLAPSARAQEAFGTAREEVRKVYAHVLDGWELEELEAFARLLDRFQRAMP